MSPDGGEYTKLTSVIGASCPVIEELESDFDEVVLDQVCGFLTLQMIKKLMSRYRIQDRLELYKELKKFLSYQEIKRNQEHEG